MGRYRDVREERVWLELSGIGFGTTGGSHALSMALEIAHQIAFKSHSNGTKNCNKIH